jgi:hypothetical protein
MSLLFILGQEDEAPNGEVDVCSNPLCYDQRTALTVHLVVCEDLYIISAGHPLIVSPKKRQLQVIILLFISRFKYVFTLS